MEILKVTDAEFKTYGKVLEGYDMTDLLKAMEHAPLPLDEVIYELSIEELEGLKIADEMKERAYGGLEIQIGYCNGNNKKLNAVEYHRSSEIDIAATDLILMLGRQQDIDYTNNTYETKNIECFFVPAGTAVELYATTLHYAPCKENNEEFRCGVVLPKGTNLPLQAKPVENKGENQLLFAANKWLIGHSESGVDKDGGFIGLIGENTTI